MQKFFITATGTDIGKTLITTTLCKQLRMIEKKIIALKPIITGYDAADMSSDSVLILKSLDLPVTPQNIEIISPWRFTAPLAPNMAATKEGKIILLDEIITFCKEQEKKQADVILVEGIGGICVPLNNKYTVLDWLAALDNWKIILVAGSYLGTISHTLTAFQSLLARGLTLHALVINESENTSVPFDETIETLRNFLPESISIIFMPRQIGYNNINSSSIDDVTLAAWRGNAALGSTSDTDSKANPYKNEKELWKKISKIYL